MSKIEAIIYPVPQEEHAQGLKYINNQVYLLNECESFLFIALNKKPKFVRVLHRVPAKSTQYHLNALLDRDAKTLSGELTTPNADIDFNGRLRTNPNSIVAHVQIEKKSAGTKYINKIVPDDEIEKRKKNLSNSLDSLKNQPKNHLFITFVHQVLSANDSVTFALLHGKLTDIFDTLERDKAEITTNINKSRIVAFIHLSFLAIAYLVLMVFMFSCIVKLWLELKYNEEYSLKTIDQNVPEQKKSTTSSNRITLEPYSSKVSISWVGSNKLEEISNKFGVQNDLESTESIHLQKNNSRLKESGSRFNNYYMVELKKELDGSAIRHRALGVIGFTLLIISVFLISWYINFDFIPSQAKMIAEAKTRDESHISLTIYFLGRALLFGAFYGVCVFYFYRLAKDSLDQSVRYRKRLNSTTVLQDFYSRPYFNSRPDLIKYFLEPFEKWTQSIDSAFSEKHGKEVKNGLMNGALGLKKKSPGSEVEGNISKE